MDVNDKIKIIAEYSIEKGTVKPNRKLFVVKSEDVRKIFEKLIERYDLNGFYVATMVGTDLKDENKIRLDYYVVLLPEEETIVIRTYLPRDNPVIDSLIDIIPGILPGECETYDLLGVLFRGNPFLKRGFFVPSELVIEGKFPLRKDSGV
ncbi:MAG: NADH-quinone oxidoreductase subunit C [Desulfurococcaceae archaeon]